MLSAERGALNVERLHSRSCAYFWWKTVNASMIRKSVPGASTDARFVPSRVCFCCMSVPGPTLHAVVWYSSAISYGAI
jgi:hypothetical protein